jgi:DNA-binding NtrC family response regulator
MALFPGDGATRSHWARLLAAAPARARSAGARRADQVIGSRWPAERLVQRVAEGSISVLIIGETGVGKEVLAGRIHELSPRRERPFVRINCAALSETLLESELFGHERGAFTGADRAKPGLLATADGGSVLLDEIGELPAATQVKLLRVLEQREILPVGGLKPVPIDVRFLAATNRDLEQEVRRGSFRQDLYFRMAGITLRVPPLRHRADEIPKLAAAFLGRACQEMKRAPSVLSAEALRLLCGYSWPGNIRELRNVIERAVLRAPATPSRRSTCRSTRWPRRRPRPDRRAVLSGSWLGSGERSRRRRRLRRRALPLRRQAHIRRRPAPSQPARRRDCAASSSASSASASCARSRSAAETRRRRQDAGHLAASWSAGSASTASSARSATPDRADPGRTAWHDRCTAGGAHGPTVAAVGRPSSRTDSDPASAQSRRDGIVYEASTASGRWRSRSRRCARPIRPHLPAQQSSAPGRHLAPEPGVAVRADLTRASGSSPWSWSRRRSRVHTRGVRQQPSGQATSRPLRPPSPAGAAPAVAASGSAGRRADLQPSAPHLRRRHPTWTRCAPRSASSPRRSWPSMRPATCTGHQAEQRAGH